MGPVSPGGAIYTVMAFPFPPAAPGVRLLAADGSTAIARTTSGIINLGGNVRGRFFTAPTTQTWYVPEWDENNGPVRYPDEQVLVSSILDDILAAAGGGGGGGGGGTLVVSPITGGLAGVSSSVFVFKRGDTDRPVRVQLHEPDPTDPTGQTMQTYAVPVDAAVKFTMRDAGDFSSETRTGFTGPPKVHAEAVVDGTDRTIVSYPWVPADVDTNGTFRGEFEVTTSGGGIRTFPVGRTIESNFITIIFTDDADPGLNP